VIEMPEDLGRMARCCSSGGGHRPRGRSSAGLVEVLDPPSNFNFRHFRMRHMAAELIRTVRCDGVLPGQQAPDFELATSEGGRLRLRDLRGQPVLVHLVSYT
jgi:hypothetical protein